MTIIVMITVPMRTICQHRKIRFFLSVPVRHRYPCICFETR